MKASGQHHGSGHFNLPYVFVRKASWSSEPVWTLRRRQNSYSLQELNRDLRQRTPITRYKLTRR